MSIQLRFGASSSNCLFSSSLFLHPITGVITIKTSGGPNWDREQVSRHYLTVEARDDLGNGNRNNVQLIIDIDDVNDNAPIFNKNKYEGRLLENQRDFEAELTVEARDADLNGTRNSQIEYILFGEYSNNFTIDSKSGRILPVRPFDFELLEGSPLESSKIIHLTVRARDFGTPALFADVALAVYIQDVNDNAPEFEHTFYNVTIPENTPSGTSIIHVIRLYINPCALKQF